MEAVLWSVFVVALWIVAAIIGDPNTRGRLVPLALFVWLPIAGCIIVASGAFEFGAEREVIAWSLVFALLTFGLLAFLLGVLVLVDAFTVAKKRGVNFSQGAAKAGQAIVARVRNLRGFPD